MEIFKIGKIVLSSLFKKPATLMYPAAPAHLQPITRGHIEIDIDSCIFCGICSRKCPADAIAVNRTEKTWNIERMRCIQCNCCTEVCPKKCLRMENAYTPPDAHKREDSFHARIPDNTEDH